MSSSKARRPFELDTTQTGKWRARVTLGYQHGRQVKKQKTFPRGTRKKDVKAWVVQEQAAYQLQALDQPSAVTVKQLVDEYLQEIEPPAVTAHTHKSYRSMLEKKLVAAYGKRPVRELSSTDFSKLVTQMRSEGLAPRTINYHIQVFRQAFSFAEARELIMKNPAKQIPKQREKKNKSIKVLSEVEVAAFLECARKSRFYVLYELLLTTGLRIGEALALEWTDIEFHNRRLYVNKSLEQLWGKREASSPKSKDANRFVAMTGELMDELRRLPCTSQYVFPKETFGYTAILEGLRQVLNDAELPRIGLHGLRHTACTLMIHRGVKIKTVSASMGHSDVAFTLNTYGHHLPGDSEAVAEAMEGLLHAQPETEEKGNT